MASIDLLRVLKTQLLATKRMLKNTRYTVCSASSDGLIIMETLTGKNWGKNIKVRLIRPPKEGRAEIDFVS